MNLRKNHEMLLHFVMAFIGGYFGLYAIVARNDLFGSAQTSNLIYLVQDIVGGRPLDFVIRIGALVLYSTAVALSVWLPKHTAVNNKILSILIDGGAVILLGFLPKDMNPVLGLYPIFFAMAFQWCSFKGIGGYNSATVFSTNNLRQFVSAVTLFADEKKQEHLQKLKFYGGTLLSFHLGVGAACVAWQFFDVTSIWLCFLALPAAFGLAVYEHSLTIEPKITELAMEVVESEAIKNAINKNAVQQIG